MKKTVACVVALDLIFLLVILISGSLYGMLSDAIYFAAYLLPLIAFSWLAKGEKKISFSLRISRTDALMCLPLIAPTIGVTIGLSALASLLLSFCGAGTTEPLTGELFELLILHALLPAVLEEALFRYVPLTLITPHSKKSAVIISALLFAVAHCNISQMPYAFAAGVVFAVLDLAMGSLFPSLLLHLLNNVVSVFWLWDVSAPVFRLPLTISLVTLTFISVALVVIFRGRYTKKVTFLVDKDDKISIAPQVFVFVTVCMALAIGALL